MDGGDVWCWLFGGLRWVALVVVWGAPPRLSAPVTLTLALSR